MDIAQRFGKDRIRITLPVLLIGVNGISLVIMRPKP